MEQAEKSTKIIYQIQGCNITNVGGEIQTRNNRIANDLRKQTAHVGGEAEETVSTTRGKGRGGRQRPSSRTIRRFFASAPGFSSSCAPTIFAAAA